MENIIRRLSGIDIIEFCVKEKLDLDNEKVVVNDIEFLLVIYNNFEIELEALSEYE